jgi:hypothetical protein
MIFRTTRSIQIQQAIDRAVKFLLSQQQSDGSWNTDGNTDWSVGRTALAALALLSAGVDGQSPRLTSAITSMRDTPINAADRTYCVALRACVLAQLPGAAKRPELRADVQWLLKAMIDHGAGNGLYTYDAANGEQQGDFSNSQYGVLGAWYAAEAGIEIPNNFWHRAETGWRSGQHADGGWGYMIGEGDSYASMTAAGAATLFITHDHLHARDAYDLFRSPNNADIDHAIAWLGQHFAVDYNPGRDSPPSRQSDLLSAFAAPQHPQGGFNLPYMLFGYERVGEASGLTRFGTHRWFDEGADFLIQSQLSDGSWPVDGSISGNPVVETSYALLFLTRGLSPVAVQKLQFGTRWNNRSRDVADFIFFLRHNTETHYNWQITQLDSSADELSAAPILYAASDRPFAPTAAEISSLRDYLLHGGLLVAVNEGERDMFTKSIEAIGSEMFPERTFKDVGPSDSAYAGNFPTAGVSQPIRVLDNGIRKLIVLFPIGDVSWRFQSAGGSPAFRQSPYSVLANIWASMSGSDQPLQKGVSTWMQRSDAQSEPPRKIALALLRFDGNWNPEPAGWERLSNILHNSGDLELQVDPIDLAKLTNTYPVAHLTCTTALKLSAEQLAALKKYLDNGGLLFFDAAGGSAEAAASMQAILASLYPAGTNDPLPIDHPIYAGSYAGGGKIDAVSYRRGSSLPATSFPRLRGITVNGKLIAIISEQDISAGLVGYAASGFAGYSPQSAAQIARATLLWRASPRP